MSESNPYSAPDADLSVESGSSVDAIKNFPRFTTWAVVGLSIITLGLYGYYWLWSRTKILNKLSSDNPIASWLPITTIILMVINMIVSYGPLLMADPQMMAAFSGVTSIFGIVVFIFFLIWVYGFRSRLNTLSGSNKGDKFWLGPILTFFINVYYFQYKINQMHDQG